MQYLHLLKVRPLLVQAPQWPLLCDDWWVMSLPCIWVFCGQLCFTDGVYLFPFQHLTSKVALVDRHQTLPYVRWWHEIVKLGQQFGAPLDTLAAETSRFASANSDNFIGNMMGDISGTKQYYIVKRKTALQIATSAFVIIWWNLIQNGKNTTEVCTYQMHPQKETFQKHSPGVMS